MDTFFALIFTLSIPLLVAGLIRPAFFRKIPYLKENLSRKRIAKFFGIVMVSSFVLVGFTSDSPSTDNVSNSASSQNGVANVEKQDGEEFDGLSVDENNESGEPVEAKEVTEEGADNDSKTYYPVTKVVDGDTLAVLMNGESQTVRLIGVDTPETVHPTKPVECFGKEASNKAKSLLSGKEVHLEFDITQGERDAYNRLLAYVFLADGTHVNELMIKEGYAYEYTYNLPYKYQAAFKLAETFAKNGKAGLWADGACDETDIVIPSVPVIPPPTSEVVETDNDPVESFVQPSSSYICSYNAYNCSDFSTHYEAQSVYESCGGVSNDVHKLDRDKDGSACETLP